MSTVVIRLNVLGEEQINRRLLRFGARAGSLEEPFEAIHDYLSQVSERQFDSEGDYSGNAWEALRQSTIDRKARDKNPTVVANAERVLHASERLRDSLTKQGDPDMVHVITPTTMIYGTNVKYGQYHMKPGPYGRPTRRPVDLTEGNKIAILKTLQLWIARGITRIGGVV